jgi:paraquat-inducible protein B
MEEDSPDAPLKPPGEPGGPAPERELPRPRVVKARRWNVSLVWLVPFVAIAIAASMLVRSIFLTGPRIEIQFKSADGVEAGKTEVRYKEVVIGKVVAVGLRDDRQSVGVVVQLDRLAASFAVEDTSFWWSARASAPAASAASARCSRAPTSAPTPASRPSRAASSSASRRRLSCCAASPARSSCCTEDLGSLDVGSPVFHRRTPVGRVVGYTLDADRDELSLKIFVEAPYQKLVTLNSRFWNASGST